MNTLEGDGLEPLSELTGWNVSDDSPDVRGWQLLGHGNHLVGWVEDLMIDVRAERARYMVVRLHDDVDRAGSARVLVPVGVAELHEHDDVVVVPDLTRADLEALPRFDRAAFSREHEDRIRLCFRATCDESGPYYDHAVYDDSRLRRHPRTVDGSGTPA